MAHTVRIGAVDIGTNSVRLLVADVDDSLRLRTAHRMGEISRLGEGLDRTGMIEEAAALRTLDCVERFVQEAEYSGASRVRVAGTNAFRAATNGAAVAALISERIGYPVEILSGEEEARHVFRAVLTGLSAPVGPAVVVDIGGGSTEIMWGGPEGDTRVISLELGCVRLTERRVRDDPPSPEELESVRQDVRAIFDGALDAFDVATVERAIGVGGTLTAFGAVDLGLLKYDPGKIENHYLSRERIGEIAHQLCSLPLETRRDLPGVSRGRADIIPAGALILSEFANRFRLRGVYVSTRGLRYGLVLSEAEQLLASRKGSRGLGSSVST